MLPGYLLEKLVSPFFPPQGEVRSPDGGPTCFPCAGRALSTELEA